MTDAQSISIHALLAESDTHTNKTNGGTYNISIHALLAESDDNTHTYRVYCPAFLSTLSLRRATVEKVPADVYYQAFLSTLSLRRATLSI